MPMKTPAKSASKKRKPLSLYPLKFEEAVKAILSVSEPRAEYSTKKSPRKNRTHNKQIK